MANYLNNILSLFKRLMVSKSGYDILNSEITDEMITLTDYYCSNWYKSLDLSYKGISFGELVDYKIKGYTVGLYGRIQTLLTYEKYFQQNRGHKIGVVESMTPSGWLANWVLRRTRRKVSHSNLRCIMSWFQKYVVFPFFYRITHPEKVEVDLNKVRPKKKCLEGTQYPYIFFASLSTYINPMIPLLNNLSLYDKVCLVVPRVSRNWTKFCEISNRTHVVFLEDVFDYELYEQFHNMKSVYKGKFKDHEDVLKGFFSYKRVSFWNLIRPAFFNIYVEYFPHCVVWINMAEHIIEKYKPRKVIFARMRRCIENTFLEVAKLKGIETIQLQHGHFNPKSKAWVYGTGGTDATDKICVFGKWHKDRIIDVYGKDIDKKIFVTGNPIWDKIPEHNKKDRLGIRRDLHRRIELPIQNKWIMFATQYSIFGDIIKSLHKRLVNMRDSNMIIKVHPNEQRGYYHRMIMPKYRERIRIIKDEYEQFDILRAMDVIVVHSSTVFIESLLVRTPVIFCMIDGIAIENFDPTSYGIPIVKKEGELIALLEQLLFNEKFRKEYLLKCDEIVMSLARNMDGQATNRILDLIEN